jgi:hypothetical protein
VVGPLNAPEWNDVLGLCNEWLFNLAREYRQPDLWGELAKERELLALTSPEGAPRNDTAFTDEERRIVATQLHEIRELIVAKAELNEAQIQDLDFRIRYVQEAAGRVESRRYWFGIFFSALVTFALAQHLEATLIAEALRVGMHGLRDLFDDLGFSELPPA